MPSKAQLSEAASAKYRAHSEFQEYLNDALAGVAQVGRFFKGETYNTFESKMESYDKIVLGDDLYNAIEEANDIIRTTEVEPMEVPVQLQDFDIKAAMEEIGVVVVGPRPFYSSGGVSPLPTPRRTPHADGSHADGLDYVPFDGYIAQLHRGERVLTSRENEALSDSVVNDNSSAPITVNFSPIINTDGNSDSKIAEMLKSQIPTLVRIITEALDERERNKRRTEYA